MDFERHFIICDCGSAEHQVLFSYDPNEEDPRYQEIWIEFHLSQYYNIFKRSWAAIRYVFGYRSKYGDWDEVTINRQGVIDLHGFLEQFISDGEA